MMDIHQEHKAERLRAAITTVLYREMQTSEGELVEAVRRLDSYLADVDDAMVLAAIQKAMDDGLVKVTGPPLEFTPRWTDDKSASQIATPRYLALTERSRQAFDHASDPRSF